jgi:tetratricopeptide (TPR) repeat protein
MKNDSKTKAPPTFRIGELIETLGLLSRRDWQEALQVSQETGLPLGKILVMSGHLTNDLLNAVIEAQTMLREGQLDLLTASAALGKIQESNCTFQQALDLIGFKPPEKPFYLLGDLLLDAGFIRPKQLQRALEQSNATGLPIGRTLVHSGFIPDGLLTMAINAQVLLRDGKTTREEVIQNLKTATSRQVPMGIPLADKGYYDLPARQSLRLGELLVASGVVSEQELMTALEIGLANDKPVGQVLVDLHFIDQPIISAALDLQKKVIEQTIKLEEATRLLSTIQREGINLEVALETLQQPTHPSSFSSVSKVGQEAPTFPEFLELTKNLNKEELQKSLETVLSNPQLVAKILEVGGVIDKNIIHEGLRTYQLFRQGRLPLEQACIVLDFCKSNQVSTDQALKVLSWEQKDQEKPEPTEREKDVSHWAEDCKTAYAIYELGDLDEAEKQWIELIKRAKELEINDLRLPRALEVLARIYQNQNKFEQALELAGQGLKIKRTVLAVNNFDTASSLNLLASLAYKLDYLKLSEEYSRRYLKMLEVLCGPDHPNVASALDNLGLTCHLQKHYEEAEKLYQRALTICTKSLGENHPTTVRVLRKYAATLRALNRDSEAAHFDNCAIAAISGSWKTIALPSQENLF